MMGEQGEQDEMGCSFSLKPKPREIFPEKQSYPERVGRGLGLSWADAATSLYISIDCEWNSARWVARDYEQKSIILPFLNLIV